MPDETPQIQSPPAVVLLSGGLDSATVLAIAQSEGFACHCLSFDYGQRHRQELAAARALATHAAAFRVINLDLRVLGGSALTSDLPVPKDRDERSMAAEIPVTYVPARNLIFLSIATAYAEVVRASSIFIGVNSIDYSGYPDCRPEFIVAFERAATLGTKSGVGGQLLRIRAPLVAMNKAQIIRRGVELGVDYAQTHSCYDPSPAGLACGRCDSCQLRRAGFVAAGVSDPTRYA